MVEAHVFAHARSHLGGQAAKPGQPPGGGYCSAEQTSRYARGHDRPA
jgi:hypothetical protein